ncbi:MAG: hypothetical protein ACI9OH_002854 [Oleispira sp.]|jgi:hypothetical protein
MNEEYNMKRMPVFSFAIIISLAVSSVDLVITPFDVSTANLTPVASSQWLASEIYSAAFNDISPGFDDLYVIKTQDKGREIIIYCNTTYCYKNRSGMMTG